MERETLIERQNFLPKNEVKYEEIVQYMNIWSVR